MKIGYFAAGLMCCAGGVAAAGVPAAVDGTITIDGVVEATDSADAAALASASAIVLNSGSTLFYKASDPLALSAAVSGTGAFVAVGAGDVTISGDNEGLLAPGHFAFTNTVATITHEHGLGAAGTGTAYVNHSTCAQPLIFDNGETAFTNSVALRIVRPSGGHLYIGSQSPATFFVQAANLSENLPSARIKFTNNFEMISGEFKSTSTTWLDQSGTGSVWFREGCTMDLGSSALV